MLDDGARRRLPVWTVVKRSYAFAWERRGILFVPALVLFLIQVVASLPGIREPVAIGPSVPHHYGRNLLLTVISGLFAMAFVVGVHRTVLLDDIRNGLAFLRWDRNLLRYVGTWLLLFGIARLLYLILGMLMAIAAAAMAAGAGKVLVPLVIVIGGFALIFVFLRFTLALPAAAIGTKDGLGVSWKATRGNWFRLAAAAVLTGLPFVIVSIAAAVPVIGDTLSAVRNGQAYVPAPPLGAVAIGAAIRAVDVAVLTVMLSLCYDFLVRGNGPAQGPSQAARV